MAIESGRSLNKVARNSSQGVGQRSEAAWLEWAAPGPRISVGGSAGDEVMGAALGLSVDGKSKNLNCLRVSPHEQLSELRTTILELVDCSL